MIKFRVKCITSVHRSPLFILMSLHVFTLPGLRIFHTFVVYVLDYIKVIWLAQICNLGVHIFFNSIDSIACGLNPSTPDVIFLADCTYYVNHVLDFCELTYICILVFSGAWGSGGGYYSVSLVFFPLVVTADVPHSFLKYPSLTAIYIPSVMDLIICHYACLFGKNDSSHVWCYNCGCLAELVRSVIKHLTVQLLTLSVLVLSGSVGGEGIQFSSVFMKHWCLVIPCLSKSGW